MLTFGPQSTPGTGTSPQPLRPELEQQIQSALALLQEGGVVAIPTDTLYGLAADAFSVSAVQRVINIKGRSEMMGLPIFISSSADLSLVARDLPQVAWALAHRFWPGGLTLVVPRSGAVHDLVTGGRDTVAVRVPNHPVPLALARRLGRPITGTSANRSGQPPAHTPEEVRRQLPAAAAMILEGGDAPIGIQSTMVDLTGSAPRLLRPGAVPIAAIKAVCPALVEG